MRGVGVSLVLGNRDRKNGIGTMLPPRCEGLTLALAGVVARVPSREPMGYVFALNGTTLAPALKITAFSTRFRFVLIHNQRDSEQTFLFRVHHSNGRK